MFRKTLLTAAFSVIVASPLFAQTAGAKADITSDPEEAKLIDERIQFVKSFYPIDAKQTDELRKGLESRVDSHQDYMRRNELLLRRRTTAISAVLPQDKKLSVERIKELRNQYQEQIFRIREAAPLSLTNAVRLTEEMIDANARKTGRTKIEEFFAKQLNGKPLDPAHMDRLILSPVPMLDIKQNDDFATQQAKLMGNRPVDRISPENLASDRPTRSDLQKAKEAAIRAKQEAAKNDPHAGHNHAKIPPAASNRKLETAQLEAPPLESWQNTYQKWASNYAFTTEQKAVAETIYQQCMTQAQQTMKEVEPELSKAKAMPEGADRDKAIRAAMEPVDSVYTQMKMRIDSVASIEQRERFEAQEKTESK